MRILSVFCLFLIYSFDACALHFIGADMTYTCIGNNQFIISTTVYRDCAGTGPPLDDTYNIDVYDLVNGSVIMQDVIIAHDGIETINADSGDPCVELPSTLCLEKAVYSGVVQLSPSPNGYFINFNDCCFANSVSNITGGSLSVSTIIPGMTPCMDSPTFNEEPPIALCLYEELSLDLGVTWPDNSTATLIYNFYTPDNNFGNGAPPYTGVVWEPGYTEDYAIPSNSTIVINPFTGEVTGTPMQLGFFLMGVEVFAVENGDTVAEINRVFRYTVADCNVNRSLAEFETEPICGELTVEFANGSFGADAYEWNFDDIASVDNITAEEAPTHTFTDFGTYNVRLITMAGGSTECSDTSYLEVFLEDGAESEITVNNDYQCLAANNFNFQANTTKPGASYLWEFGSNANTPTSTLENPTDITYNQVGVYTVTLYTYYLECTTSTTINIEVFDGILSDFVGPTEGCIPFNATFTATTFNTNYTYNWTINGNQFNGFEIDYLFASEGVYDITLHVVDENGCESTVMELDYITIDEVPETGFNISDEYISAGEFVTIKNTLFDHNYNILFSIPEYEYNANTSLNFVYTFEEEGDFEIIQTVENGTCTNELTKIIHVGPPRIVPPNVFTPNGDGMNEFFYFDPYYNSNIEIYIYNRWGLEVFSSPNYELCNPESGEFCWDGTDKKGRQCVEGAYAYLIVLPNGFHAKGFVQVFH